MGIKLTQEEKDLLIENKQYIIEGDWDGFFDGIEFFEISHIFQFCLECVPNLLYKITRLPNYAFYKSDIESINIPSNIKEIGDGAFEFCKNLKSITISNNVTEIGQWAFYDCKNLKTIKIPNSVTKIGNCMFYGCKNLTSITIPDSVINVWSSAFNGCYSLNYISIPKHLKGRKFLKELPSYYHCRIEVRS